MSLSPLCSVYSIDLGWVKKKGKKKVEHSGLLGRGAALFLNIKAHLKVKKTPHNFTTSSDFTPIEIIIMSITFDLCQQIFQNSPQWTFKTTLQAFVVSWKH